MSDTTIDFAYNTTTWEAMKYSVKFAWIAVRNIARLVNKIVHRLPWLFIILTILISVIYSYVEIGQARAERDSYNQQNVHLQMEVDSFRAAYGR